MEMKHKAKTHTQYKRDIEGNLDGEESAQSTSKLTLL